MIDRITFSMAAADRNGVCAAQQSVGAGDLTINGALATTGVATMDTARHVSVYCAGDISGVTFTVTGTDRYGTVITEDIVGPDTTPDTNKGSKNFKTITQVAVDGAVGTDVEIGSADEAETQWVPLEHRGNKVGVQVVLDATGALTYALQSTMDDVHAVQESDATAFADGTITGETTSQSGSVDVPYTAVRIAVTSHTVTGFTATFVQRDI